MTGSLGGRRDPSGRAGDSEALRAQARATADSWRAEPGECSFVAISPAPARRSERSADTGYDNISS